MLSVLRQDDTMRARYGIRYENGGSSNDFHEEPKCGEQEDKMQSKIFITVEGGMIQSAVATNDLADIDLVIIDLDIQGCDNIVRVPSGNLANVYREHIQDIGDGDVKYFEEVWKLCHNTMNRYMVRIYEPFVETEVTAESKERAEEIARSKIDARPDQGNFMIMVEEMEKTDVPD